ncbi:hypothetical protein BCR34DRAFT_660306 [Clohesyomyces aquaticus]|uniref:Uncharacterized protein n=1 Tax=Clohesyomyces aquaticus TaxID=1231657 RepID=A0A1Y2A7L3_9PLEO|nr:hypothetical protein BCR34DRAFT_660306 [Clohesyomyces aquaticus]
MYRHEPMGNEEPCISKASPIVTSQKGGRPDSAVAARDSDLQSRDLDPSLIQTESSPTLATESHAQGYGNHTFMRARGLQLPQSLRASEIFQCPRSDKGIRGRTHTTAKVPLTLPSPNDGYHTVRRFIFNVLTLRHWGISQNHPAVVRATVEAWIGTGSYLLHCYEQSDLGDICPPRVFSEAWGTPDPVSVPARLRSLVAYCLAEEIGRIIVSKGILQTTPTTLHQETPAPILGVPESVDAHIPPLRLESVKGHIEPFRSLRSVRGGVAAPTELKARPKVRPQLFGEWSHSNRLRYSQPPSDVPPSKDSQKVPLFTIPSSRKKRKLLRNKVIPRISLEVPNGTATTGASHSTSDAGHGGVRDGTKLRIRVVQRLRRQHPTERRWKIRQPIKADVASPARASSQMEAPAEITPGLSNRNAWYIESGDMKANMAPVSEDEEVHSEESRIGSHRRRAYEALTANSTAADTGPGDCHEGTRPEEYHAQKERSFNRARTIRQISAQRGFTQNDVRSAIAMESIENIQQSMRNSSGPSATMPQIANEHRSGSSEVKSAPARLSSPVSPAQGESLLGSQPNGAGSADARQSTQEKGKKRKLRSQRAAEVLGEACERFKKKTKEVGKKALKLLAPLKPMRFC